jgi:hypothetical protein
MWSETRIKSGRRRGPVPQQYPSEPFLSLPAKYAVFLLMTACWYDSPDNRPLVVAIPNGELLKLFSYLVINNIKYAHY